MLLAVVGLSLASAPVARAAHEFAPADGFHYLPMAAGQKLEFTIEVLNALGVPTVGGKFILHILVKDNVWHPDVAWSAGDSLKFSINGQDVTVDYGPGVDGAVWIVNIEVGDPEYAGLQGALVVGNTFELELLSGSIWLEGFNIGDEVLGVQFFGSKKITLSATDPPLTLQQLGAFPIPSLLAPVPPRARDALANDEDHASPPSGELAMNVGVPITIQLLPTLKPLENAEWQLSGGDAVLDYEVSSSRSPGTGFVDSCEAVEILPADLSGPKKLTFVYRDAGSAQVTIDATANGNPVSATLDFDVVRDPKAESYYATGDGATGTGLASGSTDVPAEERANVLGEHQTWHDVVEGLVDPGEFLRFHRGYRQKFDCWRQLFGYPCVPAYVSGPGYVPTGDGLDHAGSACSTADCALVDGSGDGIVALQRDTSGYAAIPPLPAQFTIVGDGSTKLADFSDEDALATALAPHVQNVIAALDGAGDLSAPGRAPADPLFWGVHRSASEVFALWELLRLDGGVLRVPVALGETEAVVDFPDPDFRASEFGCSLGVIETCTPASGSTFALGLNPVSCTVRDATLLDPLADASIVGAGTTTTVNFDVEVLVPADIALVLDDTASMQGSANDGTGNSKIEALRNAVEMFGDLLGVFRSGLGDELGAVAFKVPPGENEYAECTNDWASSLVAPAPLDDVLSQLHPAAVGMPADGIATPIRSGLLRGRNLFINGDPARRRVLLMMTDGFQTTPNCSISDGAAFRASEIEPYGFELLSIGFGGGSVNSALLSDMSDFYEVADGSVSLAKAFADMLAVVLNQDIVLDPQGYLAAGGSQTFTLPLSSQVESATFLLNWGRASESLELTVRAPDGTLVTSSTTAPGLESLAGSTYQARVFRFPLGGALAGNLSGTWEITASRPFGGGLEPFNLMVLGDTPLEFDPVVSSQRVRTTEVLSLLARLEGAFEASVSAEVRRPQLSLGAALAGLGLSDAEVIAATPGLSEDHGLQQRRIALIDSVGHETVSVSLFDDGAHGDGAAGDGLYGGVLGPLTVDGSYSVLFRAQGVVADQPFQREVRRSFYVGVGVSVLDDLVVEALEPGGDTFRLTFVPKDSTGLVLGPGFASAIGVEGEGVSLVTVSDNNDGSYSVEVLRDASSGAPSVSLSVVGTTVSASVDLPPGSQAMPALSGWRLVGLAGLVGILGAWLLQSRRRALSRHA